MGISELTLEQEYFLIRDHNKKLCEENETLKCRLKNEVAMIDDAANEQINKLTKELETTKKLLDEKTEELSEIANEYLLCRTIRESQGLLILKQHRELQALRQENETTKKLLEESLRAVEFYANKANWVELGGMNYILNDEYVSDQFHGKSGGSFARECLAKLGER